MAQISFNIPNDKIQKIIDAMKWRKPIPFTEENGVITPLYTDAAWAKEQVRQWIIEQVRAYELEQTRESIQIPLDNDLLT